MKNLLRPVIIAFSMYSALPMPQVEWDKAGMRHALCAFPLVGVPVGLFLAAWGWLCGWLGLGRLLTAAGMTLLPLGVTGGIHLDGLCDAADALASHQGPEKRLEIMKDPRTGAFGVMAVCAYLLLTCALWDSLLPGLTAGTFGVVCLGFVLSRALSGFAVAVFPLAKNSGLAHTFAAAADKKAVAVLDGGLAVLTGLGMAALGGLPGCCALGGAVLSFLHYRRVCRGFGGTTGDLAGYFLQICELTVLAGAVLGRKMIGL